MGRQASTDFKQWSGFQLVSSHYLHQGRLLVYYWALSMWGNKHEKINTSQEHKSCRPPSRIVSLLVVFPYACCVTWLIWLGHCVVTVKSAWWLLMAWHLTGARPSATIMMTKVRWYISTVSQYMKCLRATVIMVLMLHRDHVLIIGVTN